ncbi:class I SAM-dependent methyltransferase [Virgifigura deserti]|uniref:class I SAM-dependent methyltransferase n=1 Tax=Virgifigura deserti TaxID=2268457 RepID=UPI003CCB77FE
MPPENPLWHYDELRQVGLDFEDAAAVAAYDRNQGSSHVEDNALLDRLEIQADHVMIDLGAGTGAFAVEAAKRCRKIFAVDVSGAMLAFETRAADAGVDNIAFRKGGFLSYEHEEPLADLVVTKYAPHHFPDFWKAVALLRINRMLRVGGVLFLRDVIFSFPLAHYRAGIDAWIAPGGEARRRGFHRSRIRHPCPRRAQHLRLDHRGHACARRIPDPEGRL